MCKELKKKKKVCFSFSFFIVLSVFTKIFRLHLKTTIKKNRLNTIPVKGSSVSGSQTMALITRVIFMYVIPNVSFQF